MQRMSSTQTPWHAGIVSSVRLKHGPKFKFYICHVYLNYALLVLASFTPSIVLEPAMKKAAVQSQSPTLPDPKIFNCYSLLTSATSQHVIRSFFKWSGLYVPRRPMMLWMSVVPIYAFAISSCGLKADTYVDKVPTLARIGRSKPWRGGWSSAMISIHMLVARWSSFRGTLIVSGGIASCRY